MTIALPSISTILREDVHEKRGTFEAGVLAGLKGGLERVQWRKCFFRAPLFFCPFFWGSKRKDSKNAIATEARKIT